MKLNKAVRFLSALTIALSVHATVLCASEDVIERVVKAVVHIGVLKEPSTQIHTIGSGVIVTSRRGVTYVLTVKHNLVEADHLFIKTNGGKPYSVAYYVADAHKDLAVLRVDTGKDTLPVVEIGKSQDLKVGQTVFVIGFPIPPLIEDEMPTVSRGVVSALNRIIAGVGSRSKESLNEGLILTSEWAINYADNSKNSPTNISITRLIQTDAMVNSGSSGGPLITEDGKVVGVVRLMITNTGSNTGMNFAIPVSEAKLLLEIAGAEETK